MELTPQPGRPDFTVMAALSQLQPQWTAPQLALHTELPLTVIIRTLGHLVEAGLVDILAWVGMDTLHSLTPAGHQLLEDALSEAHHHA